MTRFIAVVIVVAAACVAQEGPAPLRLTLKQAVDIALAPEGNARIQIAEQLTRQAEARSAQARAALLPDLASSISQQNQTRNLAAFGIRIQIPIPGFTFPEVVGPFNTFDTRATAVQNIFDLPSVRRYQASRAGVATAKAECTSTEDQVVQQVARLYLAALRADAALETAKANVALGEALAALAEDRRRAGTGTGLDVTRARVQLAHERQRRVVAENERARAYLELLRAMGVKLGTVLALTDKLAYAAVEPVTVERAIQTALQSRSDLAAQQRREESARLSSSAASFERLPSLVGFADYGSIGASINHGLPTRTYGVSVRLPLYDGGRRGARRQENLAAWRQEQIRTRDLREQIELAIRVALDALRSAADQVKVAEEGLALAESELAQARRRFEAGVTSSLEVTDAQTRLQRARDNQIAALFQHNLARLDLAQAMGTLRETIQ
ncbi:MAG: TolC family protein [Acidobacteriota bacterium]